ncbi:MAG: hypothetical protein COX70_06315, partial [Flavobacteriales bacterium CG_4_10_14_0_2_um_filter_32_8]
MIKNLIITIVSVFWINNNLMSQNFWNSNSNINYQELIQYIAQEPDDFAIIEWFNYGILRDSLNTSFSSVINEMYLFPDSAKYQIMDSNMN